MATAKATRRWITVGLAFVVLALVILIIARNGNEPPAVLTKWVQLVPAGDQESRPQALVRLVYQNDAGCEALAFREQRDDPIPFQMRTNPSPDAYPITVCEARVPAERGGDLVLPDGSTLRVPKLTPESTPFERIVVLADSGCRGVENRKPKNQQDCDDPAQWPFAEIVQRIATGGAANAGRPDLIIHAGDFFYRKNFKQHGEDDWSIWQKEFFGPAKDLLPAVPWVMVRGNHENCFDSGGRGWFFLLSNRTDDAAKACPPDQPTMPDDRVYTEPITLDLADDLRIILLDSANAFPGIDGEHREQVVEFYADQFRAVDEAAAAAEGHVWLFSHVPIWGVEAFKDHAIDVKTESGVIADAARSARLDYANLTAVFSGDLHFLQWVQVQRNDADLPVQVIVGHGGVKPDPQPGRPDTMPVPHDGGQWRWATSNGFGFLRLARGQDGWVARSALWVPSDKQWTEVAVCTIKRGRAGLCQPFSTN